MERTDFRPDIKAALETLREGGLILYPTDTVWGIGCDATNPEAVAKVYALKQREDSKALICLVANDFMLEQHVEEVPELAWDILDLATKPTTIIYDGPKGVAPNLVAADNTLGIRIATDAFCQQLVRQFGKPLVSTSANLSGQPTPSCFNEIDPSILKGVDYVVNLYRDKKQGNPSSIIRLGVDGSVAVIRK